MSQKKIRILTFWNVPNYGCFLQAYALRNAIAQLFPEAEVKQVSYLNKKHYKRYYGISMKNKYKFWIVNPQFYRSLLQQIRTWSKKKERKAYLEYYRQIPHTEKYDEANLETLTADTLVLGSDIIWDYSNDVVLNDKALFGVGMNCKKVIAYAPSFCNSSGQVKTPEYVREALMGMDAISVRDVCSANKVEQITGVYPKIVLDPTFLHDFMHDSRIICPKIEKEYIVVYGNIFSEDMIDEACKFAKEKGLFLVNLDFIGAEYDWCDINVSRNALSPFEWLGYVMNANAILTSTFHGLIFGLIFQKRIIFYPIDFVIRKAENFIKEIGLEDVLIKKKSFSDKIEWNWDYEKINRVIAKLKEESLEYLKKNI